MIKKTELTKPYTEEERVKFIVEQNHRNGFEIRETENALEAWGKEEEELLLLARKQKQSENTAKAKLAVENGYVKFKEAEFETNAQTVGDLTATMLMLQGASAISEEEPTYLWLSKDDKVVNLTVTDFVTLGGMIAEFKNTVWQEKYLAYKTAIETAQTVEDIENIEIVY